VFLNNAPITGSGSDTFYFVDQKGLRSYDPSVSFSSGSSTISNVDTSNVAVGDIAVCLGTESTGTWTRVTNVGGSSVDVSENLTQGSPSSPGNFVLFYFDNGLEDQSLATFCGLNPSDPICNPPTDTSPPFVATIDGLRTTSTRPSITVDNASGEIKFVRLFGENVATGSADTTSEYNAEVSITDGGGNTFKILSAS
jgi:hypothetical protein